MIGSLRQGVIVSENPRSPERTLPPPTSAGDPCDQALAVGQAPQESTPGAAPALGDSAPPGVTFIDNITNLHMYFQRT